MLINFWYAAEQSDAITQSPKHIRMLGFEFALFRDSAGRAHCVSNICVHRGASLAHGQVRDDCIECPYHGWLFRGQDGICTKIPSLGKDGKIPTRAKIDAYPVQERYGLIFVFLGDLPENKRPPLIDVPEWGRSEWRFTSNIYTVNANIQRLVENTLDPAHTEFVHPVMGFRGEKEEYRLDDLELVETAWGCSSKTRSVDTPNAVGSVKREVQGGSAKTETNTGHFGPNATYTCIHFSPKAWSHQYAFVTPIDQYTSRRFFIQGRNFALDATADDRMNTRTWDIIEQDRVVIEKILPVLTPSRASEEVIVPADQVIIRYREFLADWASRGWLIDYDAIMAAGSGKAFSIPSPARRNSKGWALETTPMVASPSIGDVAAE